MGIFIQSPWRAQVKQLDNPTTLQEQTRSEKDLAERALF